MNIKHDLYQIYLKKSYKCNIESKLYYIVLPILHTFAAMAIYGYICGSERLGILWGNTGHLHAATSRNN